jgi:hypothetical protein
MSMKRVVMGLVVVLALGFIVAPSHAFLFGNCCSCGASNQCCAVAPYEVKVSYTPIQPQPGECTYCTCLPYGCPDGAPCVSGCPPCAAGPSCGPAPCGPAPCGAPCGLNLCGLLSLPCCIVTPVVRGTFGLVGGVLDCTCGIVTGVLGCFCGSPCGPCGAPGGAPMAQ